MKPAASKPRRRRLTISLTAEAHAALVWFQRKYMQQARVENAAEVFIQVAIINLEATMSTCRRIEAYQKAEGIPLQETIRTDLIVRKIGRRILSRAARS